MEFRFAPFLISVVVGVVLFATILIPIVSDATTTEKTFTNEGLFYVDASAEDVTVSYDSTTPNVILINNESITIESTYDATLVFTEDSLIRYIPNSGGQVQTRGSLGGNTVKTLNLSYSDGSVTGTIVNSSDVSSSISQTYTELVHIAPTADRIMTKPTTQYVLGDSLIEAMGLIYAPALDPANSVAHIEGTIKDGVTIAFYKTGDGTELTDFTATNVSINAEAVSGYVDLYKLNSITFTMSDGDGTYNATFTIYTVPASVTAELSEHMSDTEIALVSIIPLLVIIGLIIGVVAIFARRAELF